MMSKTLRLPAKPGAVLQPDRPTWRFWPSDFRPIFIRKSRRLAHRGLGRDRPRGRPTAVRAIVARLTDSAHRAVGCLLAPNSLHNAGAYAKLARYLADALACCELLGDRCCRSCIDARSAYKLLPLAGPRIPPDGWPPPAHAARPALTRDPWTRRISSGDD